MSITVTIDISELDLEHFQKAMETSRKAAEGKTPDEVVVAAGKLLADAQKVHIPDFVRERLLQLDAMIAMVREQGWHRSEEHTSELQSLMRISYAVLCLKKKTSSIPMNNYDKQT